MIIPRASMILHKYAATQFPNVSGIDILLYFFTIFYRDESVSRLYKLRGPVPSLCQTELIRFSKAMPCCYLPSLKYFSTRLISNFVQPLSSDADIPASREG